MWADHDVAHAAAASSRRYTEGHYVTTATAGEQIKAFVPGPLPAQSALNLKARHFELMAKANWALGRLDGVAALA